MHGGDWTSFERKKGSMPLDFSANISPLGVPESVRQAVIRAAGAADRYPDPYCRKLCEEIGKKERIPAEYILCGNGAADLIWRLAAVCRGGRALLPVPAFSEYRAALQANNCEIRFYPMKEEEGFRLTPRFLTVLEETFRDLRGDLSGSRKGLVILCEPGNPSGVTTDRELLQQILEKCAQRNILLAVDECFLDFLDDPESHTLKDQLAGFPDLVIFRAMTKAYAMAGIRLGYCLCADGGLLVEMQMHGQPWSVSHIAQCAGIAAIGDSEYRGRMRTLIRTERRMLRTGLQCLGFRVLPGEANYLLFHSDRPLTGPLWEKDILIRDCRDYEGLAEGWYRTAVRTHNENQVLLHALSEILVKR